MPRKRAPQGVVTAQPIALRLLPSELDEVKQLAAREQRPLANLCRLIVVRAMEQYQKTGQLPF